MMSQQPSEAWNKGISRQARTLETKADLDALVEAVGDNHYVLLGEASHGTFDFYRWRAEITQRLIMEKGFSLVAVEGDWPDCYRVNRYVKQYPEAGTSAYDVLTAFNRWPTWMWANREVERFGEWLRVYNEEQPDKKKVGFYGLDVYSLYESLHELVGYIRSHHPDLLPQLIKAYECFEPYEGDPSEYARAQAFVPASCQEEVVELLLGMTKKRPSFTKDGTESSFAAEQNAFVLKGAEEYYRRMMIGGVSTWNLRDKHMTETLERLMAFYDSNAKAIVWAHNTHVGDARYTDMVHLGEFTIGQLVRERHEVDGVTLVGFGTFEGSVIAGKYWEAPMQIMNVPPAQPGSWEALVHQALHRDSWFLWTDREALLKAWFDWKGHRAIGVVYNPKQETGNYVPTILPMRYDAFLFIDKTSALRPLQVLTDEKEIPETFPFSV